MKLYHISQDVNNGYDTYDSAVVAAPDKKIAARMQPSDDFFGWCAPEHVKVEYLGLAKRGTKAGVICASFNAG